MAIFDSANIVFSGYVIGYTLLNKVKFFLYQVCIIYIIHIYVCIIRSNLNRYYLSIVRIGTIKVLIKILIKKLHSS